MTAIILVVLATAALAGAAFINRFYAAAGTSRDRFLVFNWQLPGLPGAVSGAAAWTHPLALIVSGLFAYLSVWHFLAFAVPNVFAIFLLGLLAPAMRRVLDRGYTLPQLIGERFGTAGRTIFFIGVLLALVYLMVLSLTAQHQWLQQYIDIPTWGIVAFLSAGAMLWAFQRGIQGAVLGDHVKMLIVGVGVLAIAGLLLFDAGIRGAAGAGVLAQVGTVSPGTVFWAFGVPIAVALIVGAITNPDTIERMFAIKRESVRAAFFGGTVIFALVLVAFGALGFAARGLALEVVAGEQPTLAFLVNVLPEGAVVAITVLLVLVLTATVATVLASAGDIGAIEIYRRWINPDATEHQVVWWSRGLMVAFVVIAATVSVADVPIEVLLQNMAIVRGPLLAPLLIALFLATRVPTRAVLVALVAGFVIGGFVTLGLGDKAIGTLLSVGIPALPLVWLLVARRQTPATAS